MPVKVSSTVRRSVSSGVDSVTPWLVALWTVSGGDDVDFAESCELAINRYEAGVADAVVVGEEHQHRAAQYNAPRNPERRHAQRSQRREEHEEDEEDIRNFFSLRTSRLRELCARVFNRKE
jgi:hypothetical protein